MLLKFENLSLFNTSYCVLDQIDLSLDGRRIALIGANGSGKSSLLRAIAGLNIINKGLITLDQRPAQQCRVGYVFQNPDHQLLMPTVEEDLRFGLSQDGIDKSTATKKALELLDEYQIAHLAKQAVTSLSEGQKQLVCLLAVLILDPDLIVFDEAFSSLDFIQSTRMRDHLSTLQTPYIMASHREEDVLSCEQAIWINNTALQCGEANALYHRYIEDCKRQC